MHSILTTLNPEFAQEVQSVLDECRGQGVEMRPYFGLRDPAEQARLWRRSRTTEEITEALIMLRREGADWIADVLNSVGPQYDRAWATNALPGQSYHQYGTAVDCVWIQDRKQCWDTAVLGSRNGYRVYAAVSQDHGLTNLGKQIGDWVHTQEDPFAKPPYDWAQINKMMQERFA